MTLDHEAYFYRTVYAVILESPDGGQRMNTFVDEDKARDDAELLIESIKESGKEGFKVLLTPLEYSQRKNRIMTENIVTEETEILYGGDDG